MIFWFWFGTNPEPSYLRGHEKFRSGTKETDESPNTKKKMTGLAGRLLAGRQ
jgi:hypothetical protein